MKETSNANFPTNVNGATYHVQVSMGQGSIGLYFLIIVHPRIITVGDALRARKLSKLLDSVEFEHASSRGFTTYSGKFKGVPVSILSIGMVRRMKAN
jgi:uridine phosphorylase